MEEAAPAAPSSSAPRRAGLWIAVTAVVYFVLQLVPLPGVDADAYASMASAGGLLGMFNVAAPVPVLGTGVLMIVPLHLVLMLAGRLERPIFRVGAAVICLLLVAFGALGLAMSLEAMNAMYMDVVLDPGWGFRLMLLVSRVAAAAVVLWALDRVDRTGGAWGALVLSVFYALGAAVFGAASSGQAVADGQMAPLLGLLVLVTPFCLLAVVAGLLIRPLSWPVTLVGSVSLRSAWDVAGAVTLASLPVVMLGSAMAAGSGAGAMGLAALGALFQVAFTAVVLFLVFRRSAEPGRRPWGLAAVSALSVVGTVGLFVTGALLSAGGVDRFFAPGPLAGDTAFVLVLGAEDTFSSGDAEAMVERLEASGAEAEVTSQSAQEITLSIRAGNLEGVIEVLTPHSLALRFALNFETDPFAADPRLTPVLNHPSVGGMRSWTGQCEVIREVAGGPAPGACVLRVEPAEYECTLFCVDPEPLITETDIAEASVMIDEYSQRPVVSVTLTAAAAERFEHGTAAHINSVLAIEVDGEIVSAPLVQSAIPGGHVQITLGGADGYESMMSEASSLATSLASGADSWGAFEVLEIR